MKIDFENSRFRAIIDGNNVTISGALTDATPFIALHGLAAKGTELNIANLQVASFGGVVNLLETLEKMAGDYKLSHVPFPIYQILALNSGRKFIKSFESVLVKWENHQVTRKIETLEHNSENIALVVGGYVSLSSPVFSDYPSPFERGFTSSWALAHAEEACFWQDYFGFFLSIANQIEQNLGAAVIALNRYFGLLDLRVQNFSKAWELMGLPDRKGSWLGRPNIVTTEELGDALLKTTAKMTEFSQRISSATSLALTTNGIDIMAEFAGLEAYAEYQKECSSILETNGATLGDILASIDSFKKVQQDLDQAFQSFPVERIPEVLEAIGIMNPDAESDLAIAASEIMSEAQLADEDLTACIVILQAFDLVRQTLESRTHELSAIVKLLPDYKAQNISWTVVRDEIIGLFVQKFSTVQEKQTMQAYLGYIEAVKNQQSNSAAQSDIMLF